MASNYLDDDEENEALDLWDPMEMDAFSSRNNYQMDNDDIDILVHGFKPEKQLICKYYGSKQGCWRGEDCPFKHVEPDEIFQINDKEEEILKTFDIDPLEIGCSVTINITNVKTPSNFYGILPFGTESYDAYRNNLELDLNSLNNDLNTENAPKIIEYSKLCIDMENDYSKISSRENCEIFHAEGSLVAVNGGDHFFRGRVIENDYFHNFVTVIDIDMQNVVKVERKSVFKLKACYCQFPAMAVNLSLSNVVPLNGTWDDQATFAFKNWTVGKHFVGQIVSFDHLSDRYIVELLGVIDSEEVLVSELLIRKGLAKSVSDYVPVDIKENQHLNDDDNDDEFCDSNEIVDWKFD